MGGVLGVLISLILILIIVVVVVLIMRCQNRQGKETHEGIRARASAASSLQLCMSARPEPNMLGNIK